MAIALAGGLVAALALRVYGGDGRPAVEVRGPSQEWLFPLESRQTMIVAGPLGDTLVEISGNSVRVLDSPCPEKICIKSGWIDRAGQTLACLPNRVFVVIRGTARDPSGEEIDAFSY